MIHIVTLCSRPENLPDVYLSIRRAAIGRTGGAPPCCWRILFDASKVIEAPAALSSMMSSSQDVPLEATFVDPGTWHADPALRNAALGQIADGYIMWLDDDNLMHPRYLYRMGTLLERHPGAAIVVDQLTRNGALRLRAAPESMRHTGVDIAQVLGPRGLYEGMRFTNVAEGADGIMYDQLYRQCPGAFIFINEPLVYYNALRGVRTRRA